MTTLKNWKEIFRKEKLKNIGNAIQDVIDGNILVRKFFREQYLLILLLAAFGILFTGNRYACEKAMRQKRELELRLETMQYEYLNVYSELVSKNRLSAVEDLVKEKIPELQLSTKSTIIIKK